MSRGLKSCDGFISISTKNYLFLARQEDVFTGIHVAIYWETMATRSNLETEMATINQHVC